MARWRILTVSAMTVFLASVAWWSIDVLLAPATPTLGPSVIVTPQSAPTPLATTPPTPPPAVLTPPPPNAVVVASAPPPPAGDDETDNHDDSHNQPSRDRRSDSGWYDELRGEWYDNWSDFNERGHYDSGQYDDDDDD